MPRYFFDILDEQGPHTDEVGLELDDIEAANAEARRALAEMTKDAVAGGDGGHIEIVIRDAEGNSVSTVTISAPPPETTVEPA